MMREIDDVNLARHSCWKRLRRIGTARLAEHDHIHDIVRGQVFEHGGGTQSAAAYARKRCFGSEEQSGRA